MRNKKKEEQKQKVLKYARQLLEIRNKIIDAFQNGVFPSPKSVQKYRLKKKKKTEEKTVPELVNVSDYTFKRIQADVNEYLEKRWLLMVEGKKN